MLPSGTMLWPHFMGTAVEQMAALALTATVAGGSVCEMDVNDNGLRSGLCGDAFEIVGGTVALPDAPGLVVPPDLPRLKDYEDGRA